MTSCLRNVHLIPESFSFTLISLGKHLNVPLSGSAKHMRPVVGLSVYVSCV